MVSLSNNTQGNVNITTRNGAGVNLTSNNDTDINANTNGNSQRAKSWAVGEGLIDGVDYSAKYYAEQAKESEEIAKRSIQSEDNAHIWAEGTDEEVQTLGGEHSSKGWVDYVMENAPTAEIEQTETGATITVTDIHGTTTADILNGAKGDKGDKGDTGASGAAATISVGTVTTGAAGTNASITNSGTSSAAVFNFTIPRGDKGEQGIQGIQGEKGDKGDTGATGQTGATGNGISNVSKISTVGLVDTYRMLYTNGSYFDYTVTNGPTVGNGTITINQGGTQKGTFTVNQSGNTTIDLDAGGGTVDQTFDGTSANAQSGVAIAEELSTNYQSKLVSSTNIKTINNTSILGSGNIDVLQNTATKTNALAILGDAQSPHATAIGYNATASLCATAIGSSAEASGNDAIAIGYNATASGKTSTAIGFNAEASGNDAIQIGYGTNPTANTLNVGFYNDETKHYSWRLLVGTTGLIPDARLSSNIARTSQIPSISNLADKDLSNLSSTGQAIIDGKADTTLSNVSSIDSSSAVATALDAKVNNDDYYYKSGDTDSYYWFGGGYITASATEISFTLPTPKSMAKINTVTCTALTTAFRKSNGGYMPSSGGNLWNALANATVTISKQTENALSVIVKYNNWGGTNNTPVGVLASISLSFT